MRDLVIVAALTLAFAIFVTSHVALAARLFMRERPRWRGMAALVVPPLAPIWGARAGLWVNTVVWGASLAVYLTALVAAKAFG